MDIDATVDEALDLPPLPEPPLTLRDLDRAINIERARPPEIDWKPLDPGSYSIGAPGDTVRVTTDAEVFDFSSDNHQLFSPGGEAFDLFCPQSSPETTTGPGVAWLVRSPSGKLDFVVATRFGIQQVTTFAELMAAIDAIGAPTEFPLANWPGVSVSIVA